MSSEGVSGSLLPKLELSSDGWKVETARGWRSLNDSNSLLFLLPLLEEAPLAIRRALRDSLVSAGMPDELEDTFPYDRLVRFALTGASTYWTERALDWVVGGCAGAGVREELLHLVSKPTCPKGLRIRVRQVLNGMDSLESVVPSTCPPSPGG
jgi:hypothetical protein